MSLLASSSCTSIVLSEKTLAGQRLASSRMSSSTARPMLAVHDVPLVGRVEQAGVCGGAHAVEVHEQVGGRGGVDDLALLGELEDLIERLGQILGADLVRAREGDGEAASMGSALWKPSKL